ncbi:MAG: immunoglobulin domain-containing protein, partial [Paludibacteraceae bacterium]|nr:immunoglobulin domain-containing protein [Paludibacteraceae bacterium]
MAWFLWNKKGEATVSKSSCSWAQGRATSAEQPTNHALITHLSPTQTVSLARIWKYVACLLIAFFVGVGNVWGGTITWNTADNSGSSDVTLTANHTFTGDDASTILTYANPNGCKRIKSSGGLYMNGASQYNSSKNQRHFTFKAPSAAGTVSITFAAINGKNDGTGSTTVRIYGGTTVAYDVNTLNSSLTSPVIEGLKTGTSDVIITFLAKCTIKEIKWTDVASTTYTTVYANDFTASPMGAAAVSYSSMSAMASAVTGWTGWDNTYAKGYASSSSSCSATLTFATPLALNSDGTDCGRIRVYWGHSSNNKTLGLKVNGSSVTFSPTTVATTIYPKMLNVAEYTIPKATTSISSIQPSGSSSTITYLFRIEVLTHSSCSAPTSPTITATPASAAYTEGNNISLTASATGTDGSTTYTWYKGTTWDAASANSSIGSSATFTKNSCVEGDAGTYWCNISNGTGCEVQVSKTITVAAAPVANPVITAAVNEAGYGSVSPASITVTSGNVVSIDGPVLTCGGNTLTATATTATAEYTYTFVNWTGVSNGGAITANTTATANFSRTANSYAVNYTAPTNGSYTIKVGDATAVSENTTAAYGTTVTLAATPASGYKFTGWTVAKAVGTVTVTNNQFTMPAEPVTVSAAFEQVCYLTLYDLEGEVGSAEVTTADATVNEGESLVMSNTAGRIKLTPVSGQKIKNGDEIVFTGTVGTACDKKKPFGVKIFAADGSTSAGNVYVDDKCVDDGSITLSGTLSGLGDGANFVYIGRYGGTTTTLTSCVVRREITCPEELDAITGLAVSATTSTSLTFEWDAVTNASSYDVYLYEDEDCEILVGSKANVTTTSKTFTGLTPNTDYYCKVQAIGDGVSYTDGPLSDYLNGKTAEAPKYDVTYVSAKGTAPSEAEQVYSVVLPQISPVTGYVHTGWTANQAVVVDEETVTAGTTIAIGKTAVLSVNTTFTAVWTTAYTLTLDPKGGTTEDDSWTYDDVNDLYSKVVAEGADVSLPTFSKENRAFKTWRNNADAEDEYAEEGSVTVSADMTLNAIWNATVEQVIYSWEGAEGGATEFGGTAVGSADNMINQESGDY